MGEIAHCWIIVKSHIMKDLWNTWKFNTWALKYWYALYSWINICIYESQRGVWKFKTCNYNKCACNVTSLWPGEAIWRHATRSTLAQVMACCPQATSHYLNQCWLIIGKVPWHSSQDIILRWFEDTNQWNKIENSSFKMASRSLRVNELSYVVDRSAYFR